MKSQPTVPHVVRLTFLGVAGIHAKSPNDTTPPPPPASVRAVASISRTKTARGINSGVSGPLSRVDETAREERAPYDGEGVELSIADFTGGASSPRQSAGRHVVTWEKHPSRSGGGNTLAFEAELRPDEGGSFVPKTFCVALGLVYDDNDGSGISSDGVDGAVGNEDGGGNSKTRHAVPIGYGDLIISGSETLHGEPIQLDLPLKGVDFDSSNMPLIVLDSPPNQNRQNCHSKEENKQIAENKESSGHIAENKESNRQEVVAAAAASKKKKSVVSFISRKKSTNNKTTSDVTNASTTAMSPLKQKRGSLQQHYIIDPKEDALLRLQLEVFQRGSQLEEVFRQRNRLRRASMKKREAERKQQLLMQHNHLNSKQKQQHQELQSRSLSNTSKSLVDDDYEQSFSSSSSSYHSLSDASQTTWDESTYNNTFTDTTTLAGNDTNLPSLDHQLQSSRRKSSSNSVFGRIFDCKIVTGAETGGIIGAWRR